MEPWLAPRSESLRFKIRLVFVEGRHPSSDPNHGQDDAGYDSEEEERDLHHQDMYTNGGRNHHSGPPPTQEG